MSGHPFFDRGAARARQALTIMAARYWCVWASDGSEGIVYAESCRLSLPRWPGLDRFADDSF